MRSESAALEAAKVADLVVIPCRAQILDLETVPAAMQLLALAGDPTVVSVLNSIPPRGPRAQQAAEALERFGVRVCPHTLGHRAAWGDANALGLTVTEYPPRGRAGVELRQVARWLTQVLAQPAAQASLTSPWSPLPFRKLAGAARNATGVLEPGRVNDRRDARRELEDEPDGGALLGRGDR